MKRGRPRKNPIEITNNQEIINNPLVEKNNIKIFEERKNKLKEVMRDINKNSNDNLLVKFAFDEPEKECIPFGIKEIDDFTGKGAMKGNVIVIYGGEGIGKTTLAIEQIVSCQKEKGIAAFIHLEHAPFKERMIQFGVNLEELVLSENCQTAEDAMDLVIRLAKEKVVDLIVIDSIQAMSPKAEQFEGKGEKTRSMEEEEMALLARKMGKFLRRIASYIYKGKVGIVLIGQTRISGLGGFAPHESLSGGHALKHWSVETIFMRKGQGTDSPTIKITKNDKLKIIKIGFDCVLKIEKTKKTNSKPELSELHIPFYFKTGFRK